MDRSQLVLAKFVFKVMATFTNDEVVIITGASSGIGAGTAVKFAETGVKKFCLAALESSDTTMQACINASGGVLTENNFIIIVGWFPNTYLLYETICR